MPNRGHFGFLLTLLGAFVPLEAQAASFDCAKARAADERAICAAPVLGEADVEMSVRYTMLMGLVPMGTRGDMQDQQHSFLTQRRRCGGDAVCLKTAYAGRIAVLKMQYRQLASRGPF